MNKIRKFSDLAKDEQNLHQKFIDTLLRLRSTTIKDNLFDYKLELFDNEENQHTIWYSLEDKSFVIQINNNIPVKYNPTAITGIMDYLSKFDNTYLITKLNNTIKYF